MTEADWLACTDPVRMLRLVTENPDSDRKRRLFACAIGRIIPNQSKAAIAAIEQAEMYVDGAKPRPDTSPLAWYVLHADATEAATKMLAYAKDLHPAQDVRGDRLAALLREIVGNPFWQPRFCGGAKLGPDSWDNCISCLKVFNGWMRWNDGAVRRIAESIYQSRRWEEMPILADALEEAGCEDEAILRHCRGEELIPQSLTGNPPLAFYGPLRGPHVRGCWVLDLLTGRN